MLLNAVLGLIVGIIGGAVAFFFTALAYIVIGEILVIFQRDIPIPSQITMVIVYAVYIVAIGVRSYYWWKSKLQSCVTP